MIKNTFKLILSYLKIEKSMSFIIIKLNVLMDIRKMLNMMITTEN